MCFIYSFYFNPSFPTTKSRFPTCQCHFSPYNSPMRKIRMRIVIGSRSLSKINGSVNLQDGIWEYWELNSIFPPTDFFWHTCMMFMHMDHTDHLSDFDTLAQWLFDPENGFPHELRHCFSTIVYFSAKLKENKLHYTLVETIKNEPDLWAF